jgi:RimJ/RimL family protein N-acetyltransferase
MEDAFLTTDRLVLRPHRSGDAAFMMDLNSDPEVVRYTGDTALSSVEAATVIIRSLERQFTERRLGRLAVAHRESGELLGWCGLRWFESEGGVDLGFRFRQSAWGKGYATEASRACLAWADAEPGIDYIFARAHPDNWRSCRVLEKLGFQRRDDIDEEGFMLFEWG